MKKILFIIIFILLSQPVSALQYAPTTVPGMDIATGVSSHVLDNLEETTLEEFIPKESQKQIDRLENWGLEWSKFIKYIVLTGVLLLILAIYLERHTIKEKIKRKK